MFRATAWSPLFAMRSSLERRCAPTHGKGTPLLPSKGIGTKPINVSHSGDPAHVSLPGVHAVASLLKRWLLGTHQGSVTAQHLDAYLDEFAFRFDHRHSRQRGMLFYRLLENAVATMPTRFRTPPRASPPTTTGWGYCTKAATPLTRLLPSESQHGTRRKYRARGMIVLVPGNSMPANASCTDPMPSSSRVSCSPTRSTRSSIFRRSRSG
jgi:hypothetical protein